MSHAKVDLKDYYTIPDPTLLQKIGLNVSLCYHSFWVAKPNTVLTPMTPDKALIQMHHAANPNNDGSAVPNYVWNHIIDGLYLGQVPTNDQDKNAISIINWVNSFDPKHPLGMVISAMDYFELVDLWLTDAVTPKTWQDLNVRHYHIRMTDHTGDSSLRMILQAVAEMRRTIDQGQSVLTHCKAGVGRSALLTLVYLMIFGNGRKLRPHTPCDVAHTFLKEKRRQVNMNSAQLKVASDAVELAFREDFLNKYPSYFNCEQKFNDVDQYLASDQSKDDLRHLVSFKELALYASKNLKSYKTCFRSNHIRTLFSQIHDARDATWLREVLKNNNPNSPLQAFLNAVPHDVTDEDTVTRQTLVNHFKREIVSLVARKFAIEPDKIEELLHRHLPNHSAART